MKALWQFFYQLRTMELLEKYPKTSTGTLQLAVAALSAYNSFELTKLPPDGGGLDQQTVEWNMHMDACFDAKSRADEDREMERLMKEAEGDTDSEPSPYDADEIPK